MKKISLRGQKILDFKSMQFYMYFTEDDLRCAIASCELRCAVASCDVRVRTHFVETCDVRACGAFLGLRCAINFAHFSAIM